MAIVRHSCRERLRKPGGKSASPRVKRVLLHTDRPARSATRVSSCANTRRPGFSSCLQAAHAGEVHLPWKDAPDDALGDLSRLDQSLEIDARRNAHPVEHEDEILRR